MAQAGNGLYGSIKVAVVRVARLNAACTPISGATNGAASKAIVRLQASAELETGQEYQQKNGSGDILISVKDEDRLKRMNLQLELATRDFELIELLTGATAITSGASGGVVGISRRGIGLAAPSPVSVEIWTKVATSAGSCASVGTAQWFRNVYPKVVFSMGDSEFGDSVAMTMLTGVAEANPNWGNGPFNDWPAYTALPATSAEVLVLDSTYTDPAETVANGGVLPASGGGYLTVPVQT
jgi:hypothetical protein